MELRREALITARVASLMLVGGTSPSFEAHLPFQSLTRIYLLESLLEIYIPFWQGLAQIAAQNIETKRQSKVIPRVVDFLKIRNNLVAT